MADSVLGVPNVTGGVDFRRLLTSQVTRLIGAVLTVVDIEKIIPSDVNGNEYGAETIAGVQHMNVSTLNDAFRSDSFVATGPGVAVDVSGRTCTDFALQVFGVGAAATTWNVQLQGSIDGVHWSSMFVHRTVVGDGECVWSGQAKFPVRFFRSNVVTLTLGSATSLTVWILGK